MNSNVETPATVETSPGDGFALSDRLQPRPHLQADDTSRNQRPDMDLSAWMSGKVARADLAAKAKALDATRVAVSDDGIEEAGEAEASAEPSELSRTSQWAESQDEWKASQNRETALAAL